VLASDDAMMITTLGRIVIQSGDEQELVAFRVTSNERGEVKSDSLFLEWSRFCCWFVTNTSRRESKSLFLNTGEYTRECSEMFERGWPRADAYDEVVAR
jgi:hypothetical protein